MMMNMQQTFDQRKLQQAQMQKKRWQKWEMEKKEAEQRAIEFRAYWVKRRQEDTDLWRNKDFANAVYMMSLAGYKGKHGNFEVPRENRLVLDALYMQVTVGDYDGNDHLPCAEEWKVLKGMEKVEAQREFIRKSNQMLTKYGWNPPPGWV